MHKVLLCLVVATLVTNCIALPLWKVFCTQTPLFRGRADPIVNPGTLSTHSHKVWGGNNFGLGKTPVDSEKYFNHLRASSCTTCSITLDLSDYWIPDLYYQWPNGSLSLVPNGGLTVYYPSRGGYGNQTKPDLQPFPKGLRMTSGNPMRRSFDGSVNNRAISYACLRGVPAVPELPYFPTNGSQCLDGLRAQVWFPMCWDGKNLDSPNHQSHMSFPIQRPDGGDCPSTHPVRLPGIFFEVLFDVNPTKFPHGNGVNPFVWSCGDQTGYGLHGDFLSGWDVDLVRAALKDPMCDLSLNPNLNFGNNVKACPPMAPYVKDNNPNGACQMSTRINTVEDLGFGHLISKLPGCNPVTGESASNAVPCTTTPPPLEIPAPYRRVVLKAANGLYLTVPNRSVAITASYPDNADLLGYPETFVFAPSAAISGAFNILSDGSEQYWTGPNSGNVPMTADRGGASDWEIFFLTYDNDKVSIKANSNNKYVSLQANGRLQNNAVTAGTNELFTVIDAASIVQNAPPQQDIPDVAEPPEDAFDAGPAPTSAPPATSGSSGSQPTDAPQTGLPGTPGGPSGSSASVLHASFGLVVAALFALW